MNSLLLKAFIFRNAEWRLNNLSFRKRGLSFDSGIDIPCVKMAQIFLVDEFQCLIDIHVAIKINIAVGWMIESAMEFTELPE